MPAGIRSFPTVAAGPSRGCGTIFPIALSNNDLRRESSFHWSKRQQKRTYRRRQCSGSMRHREAEMHEGAIELLPLDDANRQLLNNAHPADWSNPEPAPRYNLVVLGGGT